MPNLAIRFNIEGANDTGINISVKYSLSQFSKVLLFFGHKPAGR